MPREVLPASECESPEGPRYVIGEALRELAGMLAPIFPSLVRKKELAGQTSVGVHRPLGKSV